MARIYVNALAFAVQCWRPIGELLGTDLSGLEHPQGLVEIRLDARETFAASACVETYIRLHEPLAALGQFPNPARLAVLRIAPSLPGNIPWAIADSGTYAQLTTLFAAQTPELGNILAIPLPVWISLFFSDRLGVIYPFDPTILATYATNEAMAAALQLGGVGMPRLTVRERAFSPQKGTKLSVVSFEQDGIYLYPSEHTNLYRHLYGGDGNGLFLVTGANTVHDTQILAPELLSDALGYHLD